jgi:parvulin-like peptidyl-prolyl isomerase
MTEEDYPMRRLLLLALFVAVPLAAAAAPTVLDQVVVTVNGDPVYAGEVKLAAQQIGASMARSGQPLDGAKIGAAAVQDVVDARLMVQEAKRRGLKVVEADVTAAVAAAETQAGGAEGLAKTLAEQGFDRTRFETMARETSLTRQLLAQLTAGVTVNDEQVATFYRDNLAKIAEPEKIHAHQILVKVAGSGEPARASARAKVEAARERAIASEDFAALARELSEGSTAAKGGDIGALSRDQMPPAIATAAFALAAGEISEVLDTGVAFQIIRVDAKLPARTPPLAEVTDRIRSGLTRQAEAERVRTVLTELRAKATIVSTPPAGA